ncbi:MAG: ribonuclease III [Erysipelotrichales bacterium]|nr:ribonuclease III [Erysipelotrichales bacterium]
MNNLVLAYLGDAVYELYIREYLIKSGLAKVNELQNASLNYVSAKAQRRILEELINREFLTEEEITIVNRGRNASSHASKTTDIITYKKATGLECLIGYLYKENKERCNEILEYITNLGEL